MKVYVVCEEYTCAFEMITADKYDAVEKAREIGGYVITYTTNIIDDECTDFVEVDEDVMEEFTFLL